MRALRLHRQGTAEELVLDDAPDPAPGTGDVLIQVRGASYTPGELTWPATWVDRSGHDRLPVVPCHEVSGVVVALGFGVARCSVGDEVYALTDWYRDGAAAELVAVEARNVALKPRSVDHATAAAIPMGGLTAWQGLFDHGNLAVGQTLLVNGASGGVGSMAVQLGHAAGARVIGRCPTEATELVRDLGADVVVDTAADLSRVGPVDVVFDTAGPTGLGTCLTAEGVVVSIVEPPQLSGPTQRGVYFVVEPDRVTLCQLADRVDAGQLQAVVGQRAPLTEGPELIRTKERGAVQGKIALDVG